MEVVMFVKNFIAFMCCFTRLFIRSTIGYFNEYRE